MASVKPPPLVKPKVVAPKGEDAGTPNQAPPKTIFEAAERGMAGYIVRIIERSLEFNVNIRDKFQRTALHWAAEAGNVEAAETLMDYGIDTTATECNGRTAVHLAARGAHAEMLELLLGKLPRPEQEAAANQPDFFGLTPVFLAFQKGDEGLATLNLLMNYGGRYNQQAPAASKFPAAPAAGAGAPKAPAADEGAKAHEAAEAAA